MPPIIADDIIKKPNQKSDFSQQNLLELMMCVDDPLYFIENFVKIQHSKKGAIPFIMFPYQREMIKAFHEQRFVVALCSRQTGKTTCAAAFLLWKAIFHPDTLILLVSNKYTSALEIATKIKFSYENLPDYIRAGVTEYNKSTISFDNGSRIIARATSADAGRGLAVSLLYADELDFVLPNLQVEFWTSITPTLSTGGAAIVTSTPKNDEGQFAQIWKGAIDNTDEYGNVNPNGVGKNGFFPFKAIWSDHPERDEEWAKPFREQLGAARFLQEMCCEFITDDETLINSMKLARMKYKTPIQYTGTMRWYHQPIANKAYLVALDPSLGTENDYASIQVFQLPEMIQVAEWQHNDSAPRNQVRVLMQTLVYLDATLRDYDEQNSDPEIYWTFENNSIGEAILQIIEDTGEERFPGILINERKRKGQTRRFRKGMTTTSRNKLSACARFKSLIESDRMTINSQNLIKELKNFVATENSFKAKSGEHDDLISACLLITRMLDVALMWTNFGTDLKETIGDEEISEVDEDAPMPILI
jgi:hypothetical protein